jgi:mannose-6-phosphate isomerase-like protein (cupin superfamily)
MNGDQTATLLYSAVHIRLQTERGDRNQLTVILWMYDIYSERPAVSPHGNRDHAAALLCSDGPVDLPLVVLPGDPPGGILAIMPELIGRPSRVAAAGQPPKLIDEYVGRASTGQAGLSIAHMRSPSGWAEPGQRPEFDEFTIVLRGALVVASEDGQMTVQAGQAVHARPGEWVRYSTPGADGAEYISVCLPAFAPDTVHRDE